jgi:acylphosphatase
MVAKRVVIHGRVQGVGFRYWLARAAETRGVAGSVTNRADGTVEALLEGEADDVESLARLCQEGPRGARVDRLEVGDADVAGRRGFTIT